VPVLVYGALVATILLFAIGFPIAKRRIPPAAAQP